MDETKFCHKCGEKILKEAEICVKCGVRQHDINNANDKNINVTINPNASLNPSNSSWIATFLLCLFLGSLGAHRFYTGHIGSAVTMLLITLLLGWLGIGIIITGLWALIDFIVIICGNFTDASGNKITVK